MKTKATTTLAKVLIILSVIATGLLTAALSCRVFLQSWVIAWWKIGIVGPSEYGIYDRADVLIVLAFILSSVGFAILRKSWVIALNIALLSAWMAIRSGFNFGSGFMSLDDYATTATVLIPLIFVLNNTLALALPKKTK